MLKTGICFNCEYRRRCCPYPNPYNTNKPCKHWKLGKCYICKYYIDGSLMTEEETDEWYKRGCECWFPTAKYCKNFKRDWKKMFKEYIKLWF